jgi:hypothetical protein
VYYYWNINKKETVYRFIGSYNIPMQFMDAMFDIDIINHICDSTNPFIFGNSNKKLTPRDFYKFIGQELMRGYIGLRNIKDMWSTEGIVISYPEKEYQLGRDHWFALSNGIDFDPSIVHKKLIALYQRHVVPGFHVTVDEIRIPCHHEACPFKNHNRDKPDIWAIESKSLHADNGYLLEFINPCQNTVPTPRDSIFQFTHYLSTTDRRHHIVADSNFLSALDLLDLWDLKFQATISCKNNRPSFIWRDGLAKDLPVSYTRVASNSTLCCIATHNQGTPKIATTLCYAVDDEVDSTIEERRDILKIYDEHKGKADLFGHLYKSQYPVGHHENWKNTMLIGWFYFSLTNAYILYSMKYDKLSHKEFVYQIASNFISK